MSLKTGKAPIILFLWGTRRIYQQPACVSGTVYALFAPAANINTLLIQNVLAEPVWQQRMTEEDGCGLTSLIYHYVNPYGRIEVNMDQRLALAA